jgi:chondroitin sulfate synthase
MIDIKTNFGLFSIYGFGNVAVRKDDLERIGGWEINNHDWGYEDVNLFSKFVNYSSECSIFRAVEPGLKHYYHKKMCYGIENKTRQKMCYDAEANLLASQIDMINYIFDKKILNDED